LCLLCFNVDIENVYVCVSACFILVLQNDEERDVATLSFLFKVEADLLPAGTGKLSCKAEREISGGFLSTAFY